MELKIELRAGQGCGLEGGDAPSWGRGVLAGLGLGGGDASRGWEELLAQGCGCQLT